MDNQNRIYVKGGWTQGGQHFPFISTHCYLLLLIVFLYFCLFVDFPLFLNLFCSCVFDPLLCHPLLCITDRQRMAHTSRSRASCRFTPSAPAVGRGPAPSEYTYMRGWNIKESIPLFSDSLQLDFFSFHGCYLLVFCSGKTVFGQPGSLSKNVFWGRGSERNHVKSCLCL